MSTDGNVSVKLKSTFKTQAFVINEFFNFICFNFINA